jgi:ribosomal protein S18 acetylase RimI-like enzyme
MITIRQVKARDIDILLPLIKTTFFVAFEHLNNAEDFKAYTDKAFAPEKILSELNDPNSEFFFALYDEQPVGYIKLNYGNAQTDVKDEDGMEVERLYVLAEHQSRQIGKILMDFAEGRAQSKGLRYIWLGVWEHNHRAQSFYQRNGYEKFATHQFVLGTDVQTDFLVRKML